RDIEAPVADGGGHDAELLVELSQESVAHYRRNIKVHHNATFGRHWAIAPAADRKIELGDVASHRAHRPARGGEGHHDDLRIPFPDAFDGRDNRSSGVVRPDVEGFEPRLARCRARAARQGTRETTRPHRIVEGGEACLYDFRAVPAAVR